MSIRKRTALERAVDRELISKGEDVSKDFDESKALFVPASKLKSRLIILRLPIGMLNQLRDIAMRNGNFSYQQVIKSLLSKVLSSENRGRSI